MNSFVLFFLIFVGCLTLIFGLPFVEACILLPFIGGTMEYAGWLVSLPYIIAGIAVSFLLGLFAVMIKET